VRLTTVKARRSERRTTGLGLFLIAFLLVVAAPTEALASSASAINSLMSCIDGADAVLGDVRQNTPLNCNRVLQRAPGVVTGSATGIGPTSATVSATIQSGGLDTTVYVDVGTTPVYGWRTSSNRISGGVPSATATAVLAQLTPGTTYHYRFGAMNAGGTALGQDRTFTTLRAERDPPVCVVPNLKGKTLPAALRALTKTHCTVGKVRRAYSNRIRRGRVISQRPAPGTRLANRAKVSLVVSRGSR
jgi:hypothetical protein